MDYKFKPKSMKQLLLTFALLITAFASAQDGYKLTPETYAAIEQKVNQMNESSARSFADKVAGTAPTEYVFMRTEKTDDGFYKYYYSRTDLTAEEKKDQEDFGCERCLIVYFKTVNGAIQFDHVFGSFEDLFPTWQREFLTTATVQNAKDSFKYREVRNRTTGTDVRLAKAGGMWQIINRSY